MLLKSTVLWCLSTQVLFSVLWVLFCVCCVLQYCLMWLLSERVCMLRRHPQRRTYRLMRILAVPSAVTSAAVTANMSARRLKRSVESRMYVLPRGVTGRGPTQSTLTSVPGPSGRGIEMMIGKRTVSREFFLCLTLEWRNHHRVQMLMPIHQQKHLSIRRVRVVQRWQEDVEWHA